MNRILYQISVVLVVLTAMSLSFAHDMEAVTKEEAAATAETTPPVSAYPIDYCIVSGEKLGSMGEPVKYMNKGREIQFCCASCIDRFKKDRGEYLKKLDAAIISAQVEKYPTDICVVSGEKLGGMGKPVDYVYNNRLVRFCCAHCIQTFEKEPDVFLKKLESTGEEPKE